MDDGVTGEGGLCTAIQDSRGLAPGDSIEYGHQLGLDSYLCAIPLIDFNTFFYCNSGNVYIPLFCFKNKHTKSLKAGLLHNPKQPQIRGETD